jgi:hypothetical protein
MPNPSIDLCICWANEDTEKFIPVSVVKCIIKVTGSMTPPGWNAGWVHLPIDSCGCPILFIQGGPVELIWFNSIQFILCRIFADYYSKLQSKLINYFMQRKCKTKSVYGVKNINFVNKDIAFQPQKPIWRITHQEFHLENRYQKIKFICWTTRNSAIYTTRKKLDCHQPLFGWITNDCLCTVDIVLWSSMTSRDQNMLTSSFSATLFWSCLQELRDHYCCAMQITNCVTIVAKNVCTRQ